MTQAPTRSVNSDALGGPDIPANSQAQASGSDEKMPRTSAGNSFLSLRSATLTRQLLNTVLPLALAPVTVASLAGYMITQNRVQTQINTQLEGQALLVSDDLSLELEKDFEKLNSLTLSPFIIERVKEATAEAEADGLLQQPIESLESQFSQTKQVTPNPVLNDYLSRIVEFEGFAEVLLTEANGLMVSYSSTPTDFVQYNDRWWQQGKAQSRWIGEPETDASTDVFGVSLIQSIQDPEDGRFLGVAKAFLSGRALEFIGEYLLHIGISGSQQVQVLDVGSGFRLASFSEAGASLPAGPAEALDIIGGRTVGEVAAKILEFSRTAQTTNLEELQATLSETYPIRDIRIRTLEGTDNRELIVSFEYETKQFALSTLPQVDWVTIASMDIAEIRAQGQQLLGVFSAITILLGALAAVITFGLSRRLSSPLNDLSNKAEQVSQGNLNVKAELKGSTETQSLAATFNELVLRVRGSLDEQILNTRKATLFATITGTAIDSSDALKPLFSQVITQTRAILQADRVVFYQFRDNWEGEITAESVEADLPSAFQQGLSDACIPAETRAKYLADEILRVDDVQATEFNPAHQALLDNLKVRSILAVAIQAQGQLYGLVIAHHCQVRHSWQPSEVEFLQQLGRQVGLVLERIQLLEQTEALAEEQRQIKEGLQRSALKLLMEIDPVSQGDLTVRARVTEDEIGTIADSYNATITSLRKIVVQVKAAAEQVGATTEVSDESIRKLSTSALEQANEISAALDRAQEMANSARQVADNARDAELAVRLASQTVEAGDEAMNRTVGGIMAIRETVAETAKKVKRLGESSQKISNVVNLISGFAAQTNMLALNASIEASRAGEGGKGFAVVAEEVRELARQSAEATTEIEKLVAGIQTETNDVILAMESGTQQVVDGTKLVDETRLSLNRITEASAQISALVEEIGKTTALQTEASEAVTATMTTVAAIASQNSQEANQVSNSFEELNTVAKALQEEVGRFKVS